jgi:hypothetical protein
MTVPIALQKSRRAKKHHRANKNGRPIKAACRQMILIVNQPDESCLRPTETGQFARNLERILLPSPQGKTICPQKLPFLGGINPFKFRAEKPPAQSPEQLLPTSLECRIRENALVPRDESRIAGPTF